MLPPPLRQRRRGHYLVTLDKLRKSDRPVAHRSTEGRLVRRGLHLIMCLTQGFRGAKVYIRSLVSVKAVKLVGKVGAFGPRGGVGLTACTSQYVRGRVLVCLHEGGGIGLRMSVSRPLGIS